MDYKVKSKMKKERVISTVKFRNRALLSFAFLHLLL